MRDAGASFKPLSSASFFGSLDHPHPAGYPHPSVCTQHAHRSPLQLTPHAPGTHGDAAGGLGRGWHGVAVVVVVIRVVMAAAMPSFHEGQKGDAVVVAPPVALCLHVPVL